MTIKRRPIYVLRERRIVPETFVFVSDSVKKNLSTTFMLAVNVFTCIYYSQPVPKLVFPVRNPEHVLFNNENLDRKVTLFRFYTSFG
jgi:hypothetical protein